MGTNSGKYYDAKSVSKLVLDVHLAFGSFNKSSNETANSIFTFSATDQFRGAEATAAKTEVSNEETQLLSAIDDMQKTAISVLGDVQAEFKRSVDADSEARIEYDTLYAINQKFQNWYYDFTSNATTTSSKVETINSKYSKYGGVTVPDFSGAINSYKDLCGGDEDSAGYINECIDKFVTFDQTALSIIKDSGLAKKITDTYDEMSAIMGCSRSDVAAYNFANNPVGIISDFAVTLTPSSNPHSPSFIPPSFWSYSTKPSTRDGSYSYPAWLETIVSNKVKAGGTTYKGDPFADTPVGQYGTLSGYKYGFTPTASLKYGQGYKNSGVWQPVKQDEHYNDYQNIGADHKWYKQRGTLAEVKAEAKLEGTYFDTKYAYANESGGEANAELKILTGETHAKFNMGLYTYNKKEGDTKTKIFSPAVNAEVGASVSGVDFKADARQTWGEGLAQAGVYGEGQVKLLTAEAKAYAGANKNEFKLGASAEADLAKATGEVGVDLAGTDIGLTGSVKVGVGAHANVGVTDYHIKCDVGVAVGLGVDVGFDIDCSGTVHAIADVCESIIDYFN